MTQVLEKRLWDERLFDIDFTALLEPTETIAAVQSVTADQGALTFGTPLVNTGPVTYEDGRTAAARKVVQVLISAGAIPAGVKALNCTLRVRIVDTLGQKLEGTVVLRLSDQPPVDLGCC